MSEFALVIVAIGVLIFLSQIFTAIFNRTRIPDVLLLVIIGICLGPVLGVVSPSYFGSMGPIFVTITLIIILFEGGMALRLDTLRFAAGGAMTLGTLFFLATMALVAGIALLLTDLELIPALIMGAILGSTSEAIVIPLANQLKLHNDSQTILSLESSINDVLSVVITIALVEALQLGKIQILPITSTLLSSFIVAMVLGAIGAIVWSLLLNKVHTIKNAAFTTPAFLFVIFGIVEILGFNGAIASLMFGITLGNIRYIRFYSFGKGHVSHPVGLTETEKNFFSEVAFLLKTFFFVYLGISLELINTKLAIIAAIIVLIIFLARIPVVRLLMSNRMPARDASIVAVMAPKGLAAAVLASVPFQQGITGGSLIRDVTFGVILFSTVATSILVLLLDKTRLSSYYELMLLGRRTKALHTNGDEKPVPKEQK